MSETALPTRYAPVPASALAYLLHLRSDAAPGPLAPIHRLGDPAPLAAATVQALSDSGALNPHDPQVVSDGFGASLDALRDPAVVLTLRFWTQTTRHETHLYVPGAILGGATVALNRDDEGMLHLVAPLDGRAVLDLIQAHGLDALAHAAVFPFDAHLDLVTAAAWLGTIDHARARVWNDLALPDDPASAEVIIAYVRQWWGLTGLDAGLTALAVVCEAPSPPADGDLRDALRLLVRHGLLGTTPRGFVPLGVTRRLVYDGRGGPIGMQWQQTARDDVGLVVGHRVVLQRAGGVALCLDRSVPGHLVLRTVTLDTLIDELADWFTYPITSLLPKRPKDASSSKPDRAEIQSAFCASCGAPRKGEGSFCTECGAAFVAERPAFCRQCGARLALDATFCTSCGRSAA